MTEKPGDYGTYLHVRELLMLQLPADPLDGPGHVVAAEHFFIVVHQAFELWFKQQLLDLRKMPLRPLLPMPISRMSISRASPRSSGY